MNSILFCLDKLFMDAQIFSLHDGPRQMHFKAVTQNGSATKSVSSALYFEDYRSPGYYDKCKVCTIADNWLIPQHLSSYRFFIMEELILSVVLTENTWNSLGGRGLLTGLPCRVTT